MHLYSKAQRLLTSAERRKAAFLLVTVVVMALIETASVASVIPFLAVLGDPGAIERHAQLRFLYGLFGFEQPGDFLAFLALVTFLVVIGSAVFRIGTAYALQRFVHMLRHSMGLRLMDNYLRRSYSFFLGRNSADLAKGILSEVDLAVTNIFLPIFHVIAYTIVASALIALLLSLDPLVALGSGVVVGGLYGLTFLLVRGQLAKMGKEITKANSARYVAATEALAGIKDIKLLGRESAYLSRFDTPSSSFSKQLAGAAALGEVPKYLVEAVGVGGTLGVAVILMATREGVGAILPILGLYAFAGYKLIPSAQRIYEGLTRLKFARSSLDAIYRDLYESREDSSASTPDVSEQLRMTQEIALRNISFTYDGAEKATLRGISLTIPAGSVVAFVGETGAGKTTLIDIVLGLLRPTRGELLVDATVVNAENLRNWQNTLGYVPQNIFLADSSIAENIALGVPKDQIDMTVVRSCAKLAHLDDFVTTELPQQYETVIGDRGVRLSGGQRQRIGIARALYRDPQVVVFDEATSALDGLTENAVMASLRGLRQTKTVIIVAHRLSTVMIADQIFLLEHGVVAANGKYDDLIRESEKFRKMAGASAAPIDTQEERVA